MQSQELIDVWMYGKDRNEKKLVDEFSVLFFVSCQILQALQEITQIATTTKAATFELLNH